MPTDCTAIHGEVVPLSLQSKPLKACVITPTTNMASCLL